MTTSHAPIERHPDLAALRLSYDRAAESMFAQVTFGALLLAGMYAALSPWIVGFSGNTAIAINDLIVGVGTFVLALSLGGALDRSHGLAWTVFPLGVWLIVSPWVINASAVSVGTAWSNVVVGVVVAILGLASTYFGFRGRHFAGR